MPPSIQGTSSRSVGGSRAYRWTEEEGEGGGGGCKTSAKVREAGHSFFLLKHMINFFPLTCSFKRAS